MILNTGSRTDIPAYYSKWFYNRVREGFVLVRNPYYPSQVTRYRLSPDVVDILVFCTKNPEPMLAELELLSPYTCFWFVTVTPYEKDIEPHVPPVEKVLKTMKQMGERVGTDKISWRYDPVLITEKYSVDYHIREFEKMAGFLGGITNQCVVSFLDLYEKTKRNFPEAKAVTEAEQEILVEAFSKTAARNGCGSICAVRRKLWSGIMWMPKAACQRRFWSRRQDTGFVFQDSGTPGRNALVFWGRILARTTPAATAVCTAMPIMTGKQSFAIWPAMMRILPF